MATILVPVGLNSYNPNLLHEIVENYLYTNWTENDLPPRSLIKFDYKMDQNVGVGAKSALKCEDGGQVEETKSLYSGDFAFLEEHMVIVNIETRAINNFANNVPIEIHHMTNKIRSLINSNREGIRPYGVLITYLNADPVEQDPDATFIFRTKLYVKIRQIFEKKEV